MNIEEIRRKLSNLGIERRDIPRSQITRLRLGVLSPEDIAQVDPVTGAIKSGIAVVRVSNEDLKGEKGALYDAAMGSTEGSACITCGLQVNQCQGHFGYIEVFSPFINRSYIGVVANLMNLFCIRCPTPKLLPPIEIIDKYSNLNYIERMDALLNTKCKGCNGHERLEYKADLESNNIVDSESRAVPIELLETYLRGMKDEDLELVGLVGIRPENFIIRYIPVLPIVMRPQNTIEGKTFVNDLTKIYENIIKYNKAGDLGKLIQFYSALIDNKGKTTGCKDYNGHVYLTIKGIIDGKKGFMRKTVGGKRQDFCLRTVIVADPNIGINQIGLPEEAGRVLTTEELAIRSTYFTNIGGERVEKIFTNIDRLTDDLIKGRIKSIYGKGIGKLLVTGMTREERAKIKLEPGMGIKRYIKDRDPLIINRSPGLHKASLLGFSVRLMPGFAIHLNPVVAKGFNADKRRQCLQQVAAL